MIHAHTHTHAQTRAHTIARENGKTAEKSPLRPRGVTTRDNEKSSYVRTYVMRVGVFVSFALVYFALFLPPIRECTGYSVISLFKRGAFDARVYTRRILSAEISGRHRP